MRLTFWPFRRSKSSHPPGAGLTYCAGFDLVIRAERQLNLLIEVQQWRWGGTDLNPPRRLTLQQIAASSEQTVLSVSTDEQTLGHACAEVFHLVVALESDDQAELEIEETQYSGSGRVIRGARWTAEYPQFRGPNGLVIEYRPKHGFLD